MNLDKRQKKILSIGAVIVVVVMGLLIWLGRGSNEFEIIVDPPDSSLTVDGIPTRPGKIVLSKGKHTLKATHKFFTDTTKVIDTRELSPRDPIYITPSPDSPEALKWLEDHPDKTGRREQAAGAAATERAEHIQSTFPIIQKLPYESIDFKIDYSLNAKNVLSFTITLFPYAKPDNTEAVTKQLKQFKAEALQFLTDNDVDIKKASITYIPAEATDL